MRSPMMVGREGEADADLLVLHGDGADQGAALGHDQRDLAAGQEARRLARHGDQVGLGQDGGLALGGEEVDQGVEAVVGGLEGERAGGHAAGRGDGVDGEAAQDGAGAEQGDAVDVLPVDADALQRIALDLGDLDAELDLGRRVDLDVADHPVGLAVDLLQGEPPGILGDQRRAHRAGQHDRLALVVEAHAVAGMEAVERALDAAERRGDAHDGVEQHAVLGVDGIEHGVARLLGEDIDHVGRADLDVGDVGGGDEHRGGGARQLERRALVDLQRQRRRLGRHHLALAERPAGRAADHRRRRVGVPADGGWIGTGAGAVPAPERATVPAPARIAAAGRPAAVARRERTGRAPTSGVSDALTIGARGGMAATVGGSASTAGLLSVDITACVATRRRARAANPSCARPARHVRIRDG